MGNQRSNLSLLRSPARAPQRKPESVGARPSLQLFPFLSIAMIAALVAGCSTEDAGIVGSGTVEATEITVSAQSQGILVAVNVQEGDEVAAGTELAEVDTTDIEFQREQIRQRLNAAVAQLDLQRAGAREEDVRQAQAALTDARNALELAEKNYRRARNLYEAGSISESEIDRTETEYQQAQTRVTTAEAQLERVQSLARPQEIRAAEARVEEARAALAQADHRIAMSTITAPRNGTVILSVHEAGEYVGPGTPLFTIADLQTVYLTIYIPEPMLGDVTLGQEAEITVDGMPVETFTGHVSAIADEAEFTPKNVQTADARAQLVYAVEIRIENGDDVFKIGMPATARLLLGEEVGASARAVDGGDTQRTATQ